jgi:hypothetical protein
VAGGTADARVAPGAARHARNTSRRGMRQGAAPPPPAADACPPPSRPPQRLEPAGSRGPPRAPRRPSTPRSTHASGWRRASAGSWCSGSPQTRRQSPGVCGAAPAPAAPASPARPGPRPPHPAATRSAGPSRTTGGTQRLNARGGGRGGAGRGGVGDRVGMGQTLASPPTARARPQSRGFCGTSPFAPGVAAAASPGERSPSRARRSSRITALNSGLLQFVTGLPSSPTRPEARTWPITAPLSI